MGQIKHYNNGKWTIYTSGEGLSGYTGVTNTYYVGADLDNNGNLSKANPDGSLVNLEKDTRPYKVYTALLTQSGGDNPLEVEGDSSLTKGVTYTIVENNQPVDLSSFGAPNNNVGTSFCSTLTGLINGDGPDSVILSYNTGAPVVTVLENTIGNIWFTRYYAYSGIGEYNANSNGLFTQNKTFILNSGGEFNQIIVQDGSGLLSPVGWLIGYIDENTIDIRSINGIETLSDDVLINPIPIEIRVYN